MNEVLSGETQIQTTLLRIELCAPKSLSTCELSSGCGLAVETQHFQGQNGVSPFGVTRFLAVSMFFTLYLRGGTVFSQTQ